MRGPIDERTRNPKGIPDPLQWRRASAGPGDLTPIGRMLYPGGVMHMKGWRLASTWIGPILCICTGLVLLMTFSIATLGMVLATPSSIVATVLTVAFFGFGLFMYVRGMLIPAIWANRVRCRPAHMFVAMPSRQIWIDAIVGDDGRTTRREAVRWEATCTVCGSEMGLVETDSRGMSPPVGTCSLHPFHHVYTFDRDTLQGVWDAEYDEPDVVRRRSDEDGQ